MTSALPPSPQPPPAVPTVAIIGAGPSGLAAARALQRRGFAYTGYELSDGVGGLWDIEAPRSTVYESAHLISSKTTTEFTEFPMPADTPDYPSHRHLIRYFRAYAERFGLAEDFLFGTEVVRVEQVAGTPSHHDDGPLASASPLAARFLVTSRDAAGTETTRPHSAVVVANGTLSEPRMPEFAGHFDGELIHTAAYKDPRVFAGKRVLIVGGGNSGCDIAVDAVHHAASVDISLRRGYHFVPKYIFGRPADTIGGKRPLPPRVKQAVDSRLLGLVTGDPTRLGFPAPDHRLYESHPVVNSLILHHAGHGDVAVRPDVDRLDGDGVRFVDGSRHEYDMLVAATGYRLHYPFVDRTLLNWPADAPAPELFLQIASPTAPNLFVVGMVEASGLGWQGRYEQAELVAAALAAQRDSEHDDGALAFQHRVADRSSWPDLTGGLGYLKLDRMAYYVNKDVYRRTVRELTAEIDAAAAAPEQKGDAR